MLNIIALEDHLEEQKLLINTIHKIQGKLHIHNINIQTFSTLRDLNRNLLFPSPDNIYILDLEINGDSKAGLKISKLIRENDDLASIIFLTIHDDLLYTTYKYQVEALDFINKNYHTIEEDLTKDFRKILNKQATRLDEVITVKSNNIYTRFPARKILFFQSSPISTRQSLMYTIDNRQININSSLKELEESFPKLFRPQRSYLINLNNIQDIDIKKKEIHFLNSQLVVPISRLKLHKLISILDSQNINW
ncbi:response regulator transcription factor [Lactobacillus reuteri]|nr:response regulator transcription factor [Limosilactobacillus reuteri]